MLERKVKCEACGGSGVLVPAEPSCRIKANRDPWVVVERCDTCWEYPDDLEAALAVFEIAGWFLCNNGAQHALADKRSARRRGPRGVPWYRGHRA